jgi:hypothetical protein
MMDYQTLHHTDDIWLGQCWARPLIPHDIIVEVIMTAVTNEKRHFEGKILDKTDVTTCSVFDSVIPATIHRSGQDTQSSRR